MGEAERNRHYLVLTATATGYSTEINTSNVHIQPVTAALQRPLPQCRTLYPPPMESFSLLRRRQQQISLKLESQNLCDASELGTQSAGHVTSS